MLQIYLKYKARAQSFVAFLKSFTLREEPDISLSIVNCKAPFTCFIAFPYYKRWKARLLWLSVEMPWLALGGPILALFAQIGLENTSLTF